MNIGLASNLYNEKRYKMFVGSVEGISLEAMMISHQKISGFVSIFQGLNPPMSCECDINDVSFYQRVVITHALPCWWLFFNKLFSLLNFTRLFFSTLRVGRSVTFLTHRLVVALYRNGFDISLNLDA